MKNVVNFETAKRLKEAGFPQPVPEVGQFWVDPKDELYFVITAIDGKSIYWATVSKEYDNGVFKLNQLGLFIFAPTAADILRDFEERFGGDLTLSYNSISKTFAANEMTESLLTKSGHFIFEEDESPAEAVAEAWLSFDRKR